MRSVLKIKVIHKKKMLENRIRLLTNKKFIDILLDQRTFRCICISMHREVLYIDGKRTR